MNSAVYMCLHTKYTIVQGYWCDLCYE